ncbi:MAG: virulence RhuM family protein [Candidatus Marinimicrobia bacterium]|nr:virulence RhuM family protein [Candidatus Neomarinimicrobiota bacterium]
MDNSEIILYTTPQGDIKVEVLVRDETVWLTQKMLAELLQTTPQNITLHLRNIYAEGELEEQATCKDFLQVQKEGIREVKRSQKFYNLDAIISVGYRVKSGIATQFRKWATKTLKEYITKGFVLDDERLKQGTKLFGKDYFDELLERIREIRASERRFYQKISDIYSECSIDYDPKAETTQMFYKTVQNKLHWAITGHTAAEIIASRAKAELPNMGLTTWKKSPKGKVLQSDVSIAKNYLNEKEMSNLNRIVSMYLDYAENQAERQIPMRMIDWIDKLDAFLQFNDYSVLKNAGSISADIARKLAEEQYDKFRVQQDQDYESDFDREIKRLKGNIL